MISLPVSPLLGRAFVGRCSIAAKTFLVLTLLLLISGLSPKDVYAQTGSPSNDNFASALVVSGASGTLTGTNVGATKEVGENDHWDVARFSVWYKWTATASGTATFTTAGSNFDTVLAVYTGSAVNALTFVTNNDDFNGVTSRVSFNAVSGTTYRIAVDSRRITDKGSVTLNWQLPAPTGSSNDNFASSLVISGASGTVTGSNVGATAEVGEPDHWDIARFSLWYQWTAPISGNIVFTTSGSSFDTVLAVYRGNAVNALTFVANNDDFNGATTSRVSFSAVSGTTYRIAVDGRRITDKGNVTLNWQDSGRTIYVSPSGSIRGTGTLADPISDLSYALQISQENDQVIFRGGTYNIQSPLVVNTTGILLSNYQNETPILNVSSASTPNVGYVLLIQKSRVEVRGLEIRGGESYGVKIDVEDPYEARIPTSGVIVRNCRVGYTGADCFKVFNADNLLIENCNIGPSGLIHPENAEGIDVIGSLGATVRNCFVHDTTTTGIYFKGGTTDGLIEYCTITNAGNHGILLGQDTDPQSMRNPLLPSNPNYDPLYNDPNLEHSANDPEARRCIARNNTISNTKDAGIGTFSGETILFENNNLTNVAQGDAGGFFVNFNRFHRSAHDVSFINNTIEMSGARPFVYMKKLAGTLTARSNHYRYTGSPNPFWLWPDWPNGSIQSLSFEQWRLNYDSGSTLEKVPPTTTVMFRLHKQPITRLAMLECYSNINLIKVAPAR